ncbi:hypothetical protein [Micromonospora sp. WMMD980]|uniref:hypothetical protein n=1 Tax=Micromonospora sp. WMMD980 TaxID=3016088 RepID=UPI002415FE34|nr:hypothetical protein [Micromonospora sp. WMMD980]MDG4804789.1 hypothetical protein [Micromonospora sp. WMMD980]
MPATTGLIKGGDVLHLARSASVQFVRPIIVRVIREITDRHCYDGWTWIEAYALNVAGEAVAKRELFVQPAGLRWLTAPTRAVPSSRRPPRGKASVRA